MLTRGTLEWNRWRADNPRVYPDLDQHSLYSKQHGELLDFRGVDFTQCQFRQAFFSHVDLSGANLWAANCWRAHFLNCVLDSANLYHSHFERVRFENVSLRGTDFFWVKLAVATFIGIDLSQATRLAGNIHYAMTVDVGTMEKTAAGLGRFPQNQADIENFYREAGVPEHLIEYYRSRIGMEAPFYRAFISYNRGDAAFARWLYERLSEEGVDCTLDEKHFKIGEPLYGEMQRATSASERMLLCCSKASLTSPWVDAEISMALAEERRRMKAGEPPTYLLPLALDGYLLDTYDDGKAELLRSRVAADFRTWKNDKWSCYSELQRVLDALRRPFGSSSIPSA